MTAVTHLDPHFGSVFAIEAVNGDYTCGSMCAQPDMPRVAEPIMNANQTPGYGDCEYEAANKLRTPDSSVALY